MNFEYPSTREIPLLGRIERFGSVAALILELSQSGAVGILRIGKLELHLRQHTITHAYHAGLGIQAAAVALLQIEYGNYRFFAGDPISSLELDAQSLALYAMQQLDEARHLGAQRAAVVVLPSVQAALEYVRALGGFKGWSMWLLQKHGLLFERHQFRVLVRGVTLEEIQRLMPTLQNLSAA